MSCQTDAFSFEATRWNLWEQFDDRASCLISFQFLAIKLYHLHVRKDCFLLTEKGRRFKTKQKGRSSQ